MLTESRRTSRSAPPLKWPMALAATTVPCAAAPSLITVLPSTTTGSATVAEKPCPAWLVSELSDSPRRTVMCVPAGIARGWAAGFLASVLLPPAAPPLAAEPGFSVELEGILGFWQARKKLTASSRNRTATDRRDFTVPPKRKNCPPNNCFMQYGNTILPCPNRHCLELQKFCSPMRSLFDML